MILYIVISLYISPDHNFTFSATISVQSPYVSRPKKLYNFCGLLCKGINPHLLAEPAVVYTTSIISQQIWAVYLNVLVSLVTVLQAAIR
jgi:hypothetical protein